MAASVERLTSLSVQAYPRVRKQTLDRDYDLLFVHGVFVGDVARIEVVRNWRERSRVAVCRIEEIWVNDLAQDRVRYERMAKVLRQFDLIVCGCKGSVSALTEITGVPCIYMPAAVDAMTFCPAPPGPTRTIDVLSMGRRSERTHGALLELARAGRIHYVFDSTDPGEIKNHRDHRFRLASTIQRTRYFVAYRAKVDWAKTRNQHEIAWRFFEGAAAGAVVIGEAPIGEEFAREFDWPDAVVALPYDSTDVAAFLTELDAQRDRLATISRNNIVGILRKHDWVHRWEAVLAHLGLDATEAMRARKLKLEHLAERTASSAETYPHTRAHST
jgi:hypothetical protein